MAYRITDKAAVDAAFEAAAPRSVREVVLERYPEAVEDSNGRFHAPYDGYVDPIDQRVYRGGEFLPYEELTDPMAMAMGRAKWRPSAFDAAGELHTWHGTHAQQVAAQAVIREQNTAIERATSDHVGEVGAMVDLPDLHITFVRGYDGLYGTTWIHVLKDRDGNVVVYKGSKRLRSGKNPHLDHDLVKGERFSMRCKVKEHGERDGVRQTVVQRPTVTGLVK